MPTPPRKRGGGAPKSASGSASPLPSSPDITIMLRRWKEGDETVLAALLPSVESDLLRLARSHLGRLRRQLRTNAIEPTLQTAGLLNEAWLRLADQRSGWQDRAHFFAIAARKMRHICCDYARRERARKRPGGQKRLLLESIEEVPAGKGLHAVDVLALHEALKKLEAADPRQGRIVELRFFGGLDTREIAEVMAISERTVKREWAIARLFLYREIQGAPR